MFSDRQSDASLSDGTADVGDLKSSAGDSVRVRIPSQAPTDEDIESEIRRVFSYLLKHSEPLPADIAKAISEELWNLI